MSVGSNMNSALRITYTLLLILSISSNLFGTAQVPDYLIYDGDTIALFSNPLKTFLDKNEIEEIPGLAECSSTACWRGYVALWELKNDSLFLAGIQSCHDFCDTESAADLSLIFDNYVGKPIFASWVKETLVSPQGRQLKYVHMGYNSIYEREVHFNIRNGKLTNIKTIDNEFENNDQIEKFNYDLLLDSIFVYVAAGTDWSVMGGEEFCDDAYFVKIGRSGKVKRVVYEPINGDNFFQRTWWNLNNRNCIRSIKRPLRNVNFKEMITNDYFKPITVRLEINYKKETGLTLWK